MSASAKFSYRTPAGFVVELVITGEKSADLLQAVASAQEWTLGKGYAPVDPYAAPTAAAVAANLRGQLAPGPGGQAAPAGGAGDGPAARPDWCAIHGCQMSWNEGQPGRSGWYSHRAPDGAWCKGKPKRGNGA